MTIKKAKEYINIAIKTVWNDKIYKEIAEIIEKYLIESEEKNEN